jgi:uncharacterized membrane protein
LVKILGISYFRGGLDPVTGGLWLTDIAHHHLAIAILFLIAGRFDFIHSLVLCSLSLSILTFDQKSNGMHNGNGAREEEEEADKEHFMENQSRD